MEFKKGKKYFEPTMKKLSEFITVGNRNVSEISKQTGRNLIESFNDTQLEAFGLDNSMKESILTENVNEMKTFTEDNTMANSAAWYTTVLGKFIFYKAWDKFEDIMRLTQIYTPNDLGMPEGAGAYKIPKVVGGTAVKLSAGEVVDYINDGKSSVTLETETFGMGTRIEHRLVKRAGKGLIQKLLTAGSQSVLRAVATDIINSIITGASSDNTVSTGISYDAIEKAKSNIEASVNSKGVLMGLFADKIAFSTVGWYTYSVSTEFKTISGRDQRMNGEEALKTSYKIVNDLIAVRAPIMTAKKATKVVHAVVLDSTAAAGFLKEEVGTVDGRLPGTLDNEVIAFMDAGIVITAAEAIAVITAA